jgi:hypothetical protein
MDEVGICERAADLLRNLSWGDRACPGIGILQERLGAHDVHLLSACCQWQALVLGQQPSQIRPVNWGPSSRSWPGYPWLASPSPSDAECTRWLVATQVVAHGGAYLLVVKHNQPTLRRACAEARALAVSELGGEAQPFALLLTARYADVQQGRGDGVGWLLAVLRIIRTPQPSTLGLHQLGRFNPQRSGELANSRGTWLQATFDLHDGLTTDPGQIRQFVLGECLSLSDGP